MPQLQPCYEQKTEQKFVTGSCKGQHDTELS